MGVRSRGLFKRRTLVRDVPLPAEVSSWFVGADRAEDFRASGYKPRYVFPHQLYWLPKCGPDGFKLANWMCGVDDPGAMWELVLYAADGYAEQVPASLFTDDDLVWHQQQFGIPRQIATASLVLDGRRLRSLTHVSDLVQRISRRREHKTRVEKLFKGWNHMLLNGVLHFALRHDVRHVQLASAALAVRHTDPARSVDPTIFQRIYDETVSSLFPVRRRGDWWELDVHALRNRIVAPERRVRRVPAGRTICVCHDIERGLGHEDVDPSFAAAVKAPSGDWLRSTLKIERSLRIRTTYNVVGLLMDELRPQITAAGGSVAFHSFDHRLAAPAQLQRCRAVDYRIKGYRPPRSKITRELRDRNLLFHNFEWIASSPGSLGTAMPSMQNGLVRMPIGLDDYPLHTGDMSWEEWERRAFELVRRRDFAAIGLHDCYGNHWLPHYHDFLLRLSELGELRTLDEAAADVTLRSAA